MIVKDVIYGEIELNDIYEEIVNCSEFLRLQDITQTAMSVLEYPELAKETRYEHSIGTYYLMCKTLKIIEEKGHIISNEEKEIAKLAALLHDIGHGANSHLLERITGVSHEQRGIDIIRDEETKIHQIITRRYGKEFVEKLVSFMEVIYGNAEIKEPLEIREDKTIPLKPLLATLISHNIDLDRLDYIRRESYYTGLGSLTNLEQLLNSFECVLAGKQMCISIPKEKMHFVEATILERVRNYLEIYYHDIDTIGNYAFMQLLAELRKHPEEIPNTTSIAIKKFLTQPQANLTTKEYMELTNAPIEQVLSQIAQTTKNEKLRYLCEYKKHVKRDYQILYNGRNENYIRNLLKKVIPNFPQDSISIFSKECTVVPYKKTRFGSTNITTKAGIQKFEDLPHAISLQPITKKIIAINTELLRLELGLSKQEFQSRYAEIVQEIITSQAKPIQDFELKYVVPKGSITYGSLLRALETKYEKQDSATYKSKDVYYDTPEDFSLLAKGSILRTRNGVTYHNKQESRPYKNKRVTYKTYVEEGKASFTTRNRLEEIGDTTNLADYTEFLQELGIQGELQPKLEVKNLRKLVTFLVNGNPIDISFNIAKYECKSNRQEGVINCVEIRPRDNQIIGRDVLLEVKQTLEQTFPRSKSNAYQCKYL